MRTRHVVEALGTFSVFMLAMDGAHESTVTYLLVKILDMIIISQSH